jgi:hypothetical protein
MVTALLEEVEKWEAEELEKGNLGGEKSIENNRHPHRTRLPIVKG